MQAWNALFQQLLTHRRYYIQAKGADGFEIVTITFKARQNPARDFSATGFGKTRNLSVISDRHNARYDQDVNVHIPTGVDKAEVGIGIKEILGNSTIGTGYSFLFKVLQILLHACRFWMFLGIGCNLDMKLVNGVRADERDQFIGVVKFTGIGHAVGKIAAQGYQTSDAHFFVLV